MSGRLMDNKLCKIVVNRIKNTINNTHKYRDKTFVNFVTQALCKYTVCGSAK